MSITLMSTTTLTNKFFLIFLPHQSDEMVSQYLSNTYKLNSDKLKNHQLLHFRVLYEWIIALRWDFK